jgi:hypothetical protein
MEQMHWRDRLKTHAAWQFMLNHVGHLVQGWGNRNLVVFSSYRFGSSLMINYLNHRNIRRRGEILNSKEVIYENFEGAPKERVLRRIKAMYFATPGQVRVAKLMDDQVENHGLTLDDIIEVLRQPYIVAVYRRDLLSAYTSLKIAQQNGLWYSTDAVNRERIFIDLPEFEKYVSEVRTRWTRNAAKLRTYERARIVAYEDFAYTPESIIYDIFDMIGLDHEPPFTDTVKQNPAPLNLKVRNFYQLRLDESQTRCAFTLRLDQASLRETTVSSSQ